MNILIIGSGGREHALTLKIAQSPLCAKLYAAPGNPGIAQCAECVAIPMEDHKALVAFAHKNAIDLVVVGPEGPLVAGLADALRAKGILVFGPSKAAAQLEGSKGFMKDLCTARGIPTAAYGRFTEYNDAAAFIVAQGAPIVVKADGLAAGKGVVVAMSEGEALAAAYDMLCDGAFGASGSAIVVEAFLEGEEVSFFALCDGKSVVPFGAAQDHKRVGDGDTGPNTGGMGAYSPPSFMTKALETAIMERIIRPTVAEMAERGTPFVGVLFAGLMIVPSGDPYLIEYNVRFGDPECQVILPRFKGDLVEVLHAVAKGTLADVALSWSDDAAICVVMAAKGYPHHPEKGSHIKGLDNVRDAVVLHAGTGHDAQKRVIATGGRVLNVVATGPDLALARGKAYAAIDAIDWPEGFSRRDIAARAMV